MFKDRPISRRTLRAVLLLIPMLLPAELVRGQDVETTFRVAVIR